MKLKQKSVGDIIFELCNGLFMIILAVVMLYPILNTVAVSFNDATDTLRGGIYIWPRQFTWHNYEVIWQTANLGVAFGVSVARTVIAAALNVFLTAMVAYTLVRQDFVLKKFVTIIFVLTMYVNAGLIPGYLWTKGLGLPTISG